MRRKSIVACLLSSLTLASCGVDTRNYIPIPLPNTSLKITSIKLFAYNNETEEKNEFVATQEKHISRIIETRPIVDPRVRKAPEGEAYYEAGAIFHYEGTDITFTIHYYEYGIGINPIGFGTEEPLQFHNCAGNFYAIFLYDIQRLKRGENI